jgi:hypothetical protein
MDVLFFLKLRTAFIRKFYEQASFGFVETKRKIEAYEAPFDNPSYDESGEPPYLQEWQDADESLDFLGQSCICHLAASVKLYLEEARQRLEGAWPTWSGKLVVPPLDTKVLKEHGYFQAYRKWCEQLGIDMARSGADLGLIEEVVLVRNRAQHPDSIGLHTLTQDKKYRSKFPKPFFGHRFEQAMYEHEGEEVGYSFPWMLSISGDKVLRAIAETERLCEFLDEEFGRWPKQPEDPLNAGTPQQ